MATPKRSSLVARIAKTLTIKVDGTDIHVPVGKAENKIHNCIMVARVRDLVNENIKKIKDMESAISPKELKDLVDAVGRLAESSAEIYKDLDGEIDEKSEKTADKVEDDEPIDADFSQITQPKQTDATTAPSSPDSGIEPPGGGIPSTTTAAPP